MRRWFAWAAAVGCAALALAQSGSGSRAVARAGLHSETSEGHLEVSSVVFDIKLGENPSGDLSFAGEGHEHEGDGGILHGPSAEPYPHLVVAMKSVTSAKLKGNKLTVKGLGFYNGAAVTIEAVAQDAGPNGRGDKFSLSCTTPGGTEIFTADSTVISGDISIRGGSR